MGAVARTVPVRQMWQRQTTIAVQRPSWLMHSGTQWPALRNARHSQIVWWINAFIVMLCSESQKLSVSCCVNQMKAVLYNRI